MGVRHLTCLTRGVLFNPEDTVTLPRIKDSSTMSQTSFLKRKKILVVEDHPDLLELMRLEFKEKGFAIATATNGVDAIRKARSLLPDLILLDVMLPELD